MADMKNPPGDTYKAMPVLPTGNDHHVYTDDRLGIPERDFENMVGAQVETRFGMAGCLEDGCSGKLPIDTTYENYSEGYMDVVRSDVTRYEDRPAPHDVKRWQHPHRRY